MQTCNQVSAGECWSACRGTEPPPPAGDPTRESERGRQAGRVRTAAGASQPNGWRHAAGSRGKALTLARARSTIRQYHHAGQGQSTSQVLALVSTTAGPQSKHEEVRPTISQTHLPGLGLHLHHGHLGLGRPLGLALAALAALLLLFLLGLASERGAGRGGGVVGVGWVGEAARRPPECRWTGSCRMRARSAARPGRLRGGGHPATLLPRPAARPPPVRPCLAPHLRRADQVLALRVEGVQRVGALGQADEV